MRGLEVERMYTAIHIRSFPFTCLYHLKDKHGYLCLGAHGSVPFYLLVHYRREYAEGFASCLGSVLDAVRRRDTAALNFC